MRREGLDLAMRFDCVPIPQPSAPPPVPALAPPGAAAGRRDDPDPAAAGGAGPDRPGRGAAPGRRGAGQGQVRRHPAVAGSTWPTGPTRWCSAWSSCSSGSSATGSVAAAGSTGASCSSVLLLLAAVAWSSGGSACRAGVGGRRDAAVDLDPTRAAADYRATGRAGRGRRRLGRGGAGPVPRGGPGAGGADHPRRPAGPDRLGGGLPGLAGAAGLQRVPSERGAETFNAVVYGDRPADPGDLRAAGGPGRPGDGGGRPGPTWPRTSRWRPDEPRRPSAGCAGSPGILAGRDPGRGWPWWLSWAAPTGSRPTTRGRPPPPARERWVRCWRPRASRSRHRRAGDAATARVRTGPWWWPTPTG